jgi:O-antigen ligase
MSKILPYGYENTTNAYDFRLHSLMLEPAHFAGIILPAFLFYLYNFKKYILRFIVIAISLILSFSSVGYIGILVCLVIVSSGSFLRKLIFVFAAYVLGLLSYTYIPNIKLRFDDTFSVYKNGDYDFTGLNLSTYALLSNFYIANSVFNDSPIIGHGIGSHPISHKRYINGVTAGESLENQGLTNINDEDANSLLLRLISEIGLLGIFGVLIFIILCYSKNKLHISECIIVYFLYKLFRDGHYFSPEMYFFVFMYVYIKKEASYKYIVVN